MLSASDAFYVIPLSVQKEDDHYYIGNAELDEFYQFPEEGLRIIAMLRDGRSIDAIKSTLAAEHEDQIDVDDFIGTLLEIGFIYPQQEQGRFREAIQAKTDGDRRIVFEADLPIARALFSRPVLVAYVAIIAYAAYAMIVDPRLHLNLSAFYLEKHMTLTLLVLLVLYSFTASLHELGHLLAASKRGVRSKLGIGNRLWNIVAEADMTGLLSLPRKQRYLPLCAGMMVDLLSIAVVTLILKSLFERGYDGFAIQLLQALVLQILISISWQFRIFMRTDVYYLVCNHYGFTDLDGRARTFLDNQVHTATGGLFGKRSEGFEVKHVGIARAFFAVWLIGNLAAIAFLVLVLIPTIYMYFVRAYDALNSPYVPASTAYDLFAFATISAVLLMIGLFMWLRPKKNRE
jgi:putative peptide zinc metalloprotease protein